MTEKKVKEAKEKVLEETPKKKRQSGKRKPKPKIEDVPKEEVSLPQQKAEEAIDTLVLGNLAKEVISMPPLPLELSKQAKGWETWLEYQKMTPEEFVSKYPSHKMKHLVEEIIQFKAKKQ